LPHPFAPAVLRTPLKAHTLPSLRSSSTATPPHRTLHFLHGYLLDFGLVRFAVTTSGFGHFTFTGSKFTFTFYAHACIALFRAGLLPVWFRPHALSPHPTGRAYPHGAAAPRIAYAATRTGFAAARRAIIPYRDFPPLLTPLPTCHTCARVSRAPLRDTITALTHRTPLRIYRPFRASCALILRYVSASTSTPLRVWRMASRYADITQRSTPLPAHIALIPLPAR